MTYWIEYLPGDRAQLHADLTDGDGSLLTWPVGSPAPRAAVEAFAAEVKLTYRVRRKGGAS